MSGLRERRHQIGRRLIGAGMAVLVGYLTSARYRDAMATRPRLGTTVTALLALASIAWALGGQQAAAVTRAQRPASSSSWTSYDGDGAAGSMAAVNTTIRAWTSPSLDGEIYGQPLVSSGHVYVATEDDTVY